MQITVSKSDLENTLRVAEVGIGGKGADLTNHFLFRVHAGAVQILAFNQRICVSAPLKCTHEGEDGDAFTFEGWRLSRWLGGVGDVDINIEQVSTSEVKISDPKGAIHLASLDPTKFPFWDGTFAEAKLVSTLPSERLLSAFNYARIFISDNDTTRPEISQVEVREGALWATDKKAVTLITLEGLGDSSLRVHGKDIPSVTKFLGLKGTEDVEIMEHDRTVFFRRADGAVLGASRPIAQFPSLNVPTEDNDPIKWEIKTEDLLRGIQRLSASADKDNKRLKFSFDGTNVVLGVTSLTGREDTFPLDCVEQEGAVDLPKEGFWLDYHYVTHIVGHFGGDTVKFGINQRGKGGYVQFRRSVGEDKYQTVVVWRI